MTLHDTIISNYCDIITAHRAKIGKDFAEALAIYSALYGEQDKMAVWSMGPGGLDILRKRASFDGIK